MPSGVPRSANRIIATSVGLMLLVSTVVGFLGWRLLSQEEALVHQQARAHLERTADQMMAGFLRRLEQIESWLGPEGRLTVGDPPVESGAILAWFSEGRVDVTPSGRRPLYYPVGAGAGTIGPSVFARADQLASETATLEAAAAVLVRMTKSEDPLIAAEALLRLARLQGKRGQVAEALSTYDSLSRWMGDDDPSGEGLMAGGLMQLLLRSDPDQYRYFRLPEGSVSREQIEI